MHAPRNRNFSSRLARITALKDSGAHAFDDGRYEAAIADYSNALLVDPKNLQLRKLLYTNRGMAKLKVRRLAVALRPSTCCASSSADICVAQLGKNLHAAVADFTSALTLSPRFIKALKHRADAYAQLGHLSSALDDLERAIDAAQEGAEKKALVGERDEVRLKIAEEKQRKEREEEERRWREKQAKRKVRAQCSRCSSLSTLPSRLSCSKIRVPCSRSSRARRTTTRSSASTATRPTSSSRRPSASRPSLLVAERDAALTLAVSRSRSMSLKHHPDKGGSQEAFVQVRIPLFSPYR